MPGLSTGRLQKWLTFVVLFLAVILLISFSLPLLAEKFLLPRLFPSEVATQYRVGIYRLGLKGCTLNISGRSEAQPLITTGNIRIEWTLSGLKNGRIDLLFLDGLQVKIPVPAENRPSTVSSSAAASADNASAGNRGENGSLPPFLIDAIKVRNSAISFTYRQRDYWIPIALEGKREQEDSPGADGLLHYSFILSIASQVFEADLTYHHQQRLLAARVKTDLDLNQLSGIACDFMSPSLKINGKAAADLSFETGLQPFSVEHLTGNIGISDLLVRNDSVRIRSERGTPLRLALSGSGTGIDLEAEGLVLENPLQASVRFAGSLFFPGEGAAGHGVLLVQHVPEQQVAPGLILTHAPSTGMLIDGEYRDDMVRLHLQSADRKTDRKEKFVVNHGENRLEADSLGIETHLQYALQPDHSSVAVDLLLQGAGLTVHTPDAVLSVPAVELKGGGTVESLEKSPVYSFVGDLHAAGAALGMEKQKFNLQEIQIEAPLSWPVRKGQPDGVLQIGGIVLHDIQLGSLKAKLSQENDRIEVDGNVVGSIVPDGEIMFTGYLNLPGSNNSLVELKFSAPPMAIAPDNFSSFFPAAGKLSGHGQLSMEGQATIYQDRTAASVSFGLHDGFLEIPALQTRAEGIDVEVDFPDLPALHSSPGQKISVEKLSSKKLRFNGIKGSFMVESAESFFVEKISANWSGGRIFTSSFRLQKEKPEIETALLCDRLELSEVLTQLGLARAEGKGGVSGRIPLSYKNGNLYVDDGFLFSTPGETGTLRILQSEQLTAGIPEDVPQFSPIHFAGAALKNFQYNWAKLLVSSEEENLLLKLQVDGKPAEKLPYRFDTGQNIFVRLGQEESGGIDQPIKLDVNFNVPLNELLRYNKELQSIMQNTR